MPSVGSSHHDVGKREGVRVGDPDRQEKGRELKVLREYACLSGGDVLKVAAGS
jgi:hypothetical protein